MRHSLKFSPCNQTTLESCIVKGGNWRGVTDGWMETWTSLATVLRGTSWSRWNHRESTLWFDPSSSLPSKGDMAGRCLSAWPFVSTCASESMRLSWWMRYHCKNALPWSNIRGYTMVPWPNIREYEVGNLEWRFGSSQAFQDENPTPFTWLVSQSTSSVFLSHQISTSHQPASSTFLS